MTADVRTSHLEWKWMAERVWGVGRGVRGGGGEQDKMYHCNDPEKAVVYPFPSGSITAHSIGGVSKGFGMHGLDSLSKTSFLGAQICAGECQIRALRKATAQELQKSSPGRRDNSVAVSMRSTAVRKHLQEADGSRFA